MKNKLLLLPRSCRPIGLLLLPFAAALLIAAYDYNFSLDFLRFNMNPAPAGNDILSGDGEVLVGKNFSADYTGTVGMVLTLISLFLIAFSRERLEDEYVGYIRLRALQVSVYAYCLILCVAALILFGGHFLIVMEINLFTVLILFIIVYQYLLRVKPRFAAKGQL
jgi:hypothetical protein